MKLFIVVVASFCVLLLPGCATTNQIELDRTKLSGIKAVAVNRQVQMPKNPYFKNQAQLAGLLVGGVVGAMAVSYPASNQIEDAMLKNDISVDQILRDQFIQELNSSGLFSVDTTKPVDADFQLKITKYGLSSIPWKTELQPVVAVQAQFVQSDGSILWSMVRGMNNHSDPEIPARLFDDYMNDIELLRAGYTAACQVVVRDLIRDLWGSRGK